MSTHQEHQKDLLFKEIDVIQSEIARLDSNGLKIKEWTLAIWASLLAYGVSKDNALIVIASIIATLSFALVESTYRRFQLRFIEISRELEDTLAGKGAEEYRYQVHATATGQRGQRNTLSELAEALGQPQFWLFYLILSFFAAACAAYIQRQTIDF